MVTIKDVARKAGVSHATVSYVLNGKAGEAKTRISDVASERVKAVAAQLGYQRNEIARSVSTGKTNVIGFLIQDVPSEFCANLQNGIMKAAYENNYFIKVIYAKQNCDGMDIARICIGQRLAGLIAYNVPDKNLFSQLYRQISKYEIPLAIAAGVSHLDLDVDKCIRIYANNMQGGSLAFKHLYAQGHRSFFISAEYSGSEWADRRLNGFVAAAQEAGISIPETNICRTEGLLPKGELEKRIKTAKATAIFCMSDYSALSIITQLQQAGIRVPADVAVVGYGNLSFCDFSNPAITSIEEHLSQIGNRTVNVLLDKVRSGNIAELHEEYSETIDVELVVRASTNFNR